MRSIELLSPARNLECGIEAIRHGADAVYIGAPRFGARAAAGNSIEDIAALVRFAHPFGVRIYVTLNTLLHDDELPEAQALIDQLATIDVDALIVQDERIRSSQIFSPLPLHSSTQMDNRTIEDVRARLEAGYQQTVLARELSLDDIRTIHEAVPQMPLEVFVHGALCVCYSGRCFASEYCFGRSANRGECAQFCRLPFDLIDADGKIIEQQRHLLSLRDMNRADDIEALMDAGVTSFKIEGRLKDVSYVKNTTAYYRQRIDEIIERREGEFCRSSYGHSIFTFQPDLNKTFNRRFTDYFLHERTKDMACFATPKAIGEPVGKVKEITPSNPLTATKRPSHLISHRRETTLSVTDTTTFSNGDGLCFFDDKDRLQGFRINRVEEGRLYPADPSILNVLHKGTPLFRNYDAAFERQLARPSADRRIPVRWLLEDTEEGFRLTLQVIQSSVIIHQSSIPFPYPHELARTPQADNIRRQLIRLGDTSYICTEADIALRLSDNWFIPASVLGEWRRQVVERPTPLPLKDSPPALPREGAESLAKRKDCSSGNIIAPSLTGKVGGESSPLMTCRYCLRYALGYCTRDTKLSSTQGKERERNRPFREPLSLRLADGRTFPLRFDCQRCEMQVLRPAHPH